MTTIDDYWLHFTSVGGLYSIKRITNVKRNKARGVELHFGKGNDPIAVNDAEEGAQALRWWRQERRGIP